MSRSMTTTGIDDVLNQLSRFEGAASAVAKMSLYEGAKVAAAAYNTSVNGIVTEQFQYATGAEKRLPSPEEKNALQVGIAKFDGSGSAVTTSVGISGGYSEIAGKQVPNLLVARAINSGTSFMNKQPFVRKAQNSLANAASAAIQAKAEQLLQEITKE